MPPLLRGHRGKIGATRKPINPVSRVAALRVSGALYRSIIGVRNLVPPVALPWGEELAYNAMVRLWLR